MAINELHIDRELRVELRETEQEIVLAFRGISNARDASVFLNPIFVHAAAHALEATKTMVLDFRALDAMNSSTVSPILRVLDQARRSLLRVVIQYDPARRWQALSFGVLRAFETPDHRIHIAQA